MERFTLPQSHSMLSASPVTVRAHTTEGEGQGESETSEGHGEGKTVRARTRARARVGAGGGAFRLYVNLLDAYIERQTEDKRRGLEDALALSLHVRCVAAGVAQPQRVEEEA